MDLRAFPFNSYQVVGTGGEISYDRPYNANDWYDFFKVFVGNGVSALNSTSLQVTANNPLAMNVVVKKGEIFINGTVGILEEDAVLMINAASNQARIDRVIARRDLNTDARKVEILVKQGTPAAQPVAPTLERDAEIHEMALADILINAGAVSITNANITDKRLDKELCGVVHTLFEQLDTTTINQQYDQWLLDIQAQGLEDLQESKQGFDDFIAANESDIQRVLAERKFSTIETIIVETSSWQKVGDKYETTVTLANTTTETIVRPVISYTNSDEVYEQVANCYIRPYEQGTNYVKLKSSDLPVTFTLDVEEWY